MIGNKWMIAINILYKCIKYNKKKKKKFVKYRDKYIEFNISSFSVSFGYYQSNCET